MKLRNLCFTALLVVPLSTFADTKPESHPQVDPQMEAFMKASTPGQEHKLLENYVGKWNHTVSMWMTPDAPPEVSKGTSQIESIMGGRFIRQKVSGTSMGQPFEGLGITGYDNVQKHLTSTWLDNMSTGMMVGSGKFNESKNVITEEGTFSCPLTESGKRPFRSVWTLPKNNTFKYEMYSPGEDGKEYKMMEIVYTRAG